MDRVATVDGAEATPHNARHQHDDLRYVLRWCHYARTTPSLNQPSSGYFRHSPYPQRQRTPSQVFTTPPTGIQPLNSTTVTPTPSLPNSSGRLQLTVHVIVKETVNKHDKSGKLLAPFVITGNSFPALMRQLWEKYWYRVTTLAVKKEEVAGLL